MKTLTVFLICLFLPGLLLADPEASSQCNVHVAVFDEDPAGINVRSEANGTILGTLPPESYFTMLEVRGKWARVTGFELPAGTEKKDWPKYPKRDTGWVHTSLLGTFTRRSSTSFFSIPSNKAKPVFIKGESELMLSFLGCKGSWLKVAVPGRKTGPLWVEKDDTCPLSWTTCS